MSGFTDLHISRTFTGHSVEDACPCPQAPCGLVIVAAIVHTCPQHGKIGRGTILAMHEGEDCPGDGVTPNLHRGVVWDGSTLHAERIARQLNQAGIFATAGAEFQRSTFHSYLKVGVSTGLVSLLPGNRVGLDGNGAVYIEDGSA